ncbi:MAG: hypothetical protein KIT86_05610 [Hydrogenophaga sp.]|uniref:hypothetical protein n=1 Tax=Hydrogenophaga sp. TaxID=1904254 RepID=UPI00262AA9AF|nr:hypothetical protein [Hydrogenophaga sp.]MCW5669117.1 hypothetical protein [Hydrogenophaga sp.]
MSTVDVEMLLARLRDELGRFGSVAEASRQIGEPSPLGLRDVCNGRKRLSAELLARLAAEGVDALYVLTGERLVTRSDLNPMLRAVVDDLERCSPEKQIEAVKYVSMLAAGVTPPAPVANAARKKPPAKRPPRTQPKKKN